MHAESGRDYSPVDHSKARAARPFRPGQVEYRASFTKKLTAEAEMFLRMVILEQKANAKPASGVNHVAINKLVNNIYTAAEAKLVSDYGFTQEELQWGLPGWISQELKKPVQ